jgi:hypothetical protein
MTKIKVLDLDDLYKFYVHDFFSWNHLLFENIVSSCYFLKFKFWIDKKNPHENMTKIKVVDPEKLYNFVVDNFFIWIHLGSQTINLKLV